MLIVVVPPIGKLAFPRTKKDAYPTLNLQFDP